jgi:hypothetical protein
MGQRTCAFCGSTDELTREHVWPRWVGDLVGGEKGMTAREVEGAVEDAWLARPATLTVRNVCRDCNGGWMAGLEAEAKPLLTPMIAGRRTSLSAGERKLIAYWTAKTVSVGDLAGPESDRALPSELLHRLRTDPGPWPSTVTIAARYHGRRYPLRIGRRVDTTTLKVRGQSQPWKTFIASVSVGALVLQVWGHGMTNVVDLRPRSWKARYAHLIWPDATDAPWPPVDALSDENVARFMGSL